MKKILAGFVLGVLVVPAFTYAAPDSISSMAVQLLSLERRVSVLESAAVAPANLPSEIKRLETTIKDKEKALTKFEKKEKAACTSVFATNATCQEYHNQHDAFAQEITAAKDKLYSYRVMGA